MVEKRCLILSLTVFSLMLPDRLWSLGDSPGLPTTPSIALDSLPDKGIDPFEKMEDKDQRRRDQNAKDFRQLKLIDSVGWIKVNAIKGVDESMEQLERERLQRKASALREFCQDSRFQKIVELDSLKGMSPEERAFCRERLRLSNPLMP